MRKFILLIGFCLFLVTAQAQRVGVKTNLAGWAAFGTINAGVEPALTPYLTFAVDGYYNPYTPGDSGKSTKMWGVQPEIRYWLKEKFSGAYLGINSLYASYDWGVNKYRYDGWMTGVGVGVGYSLPFTERWRAGVGIGAGWLRRDYSKSGLPQYTDSNVTYYDGALRDSFSITKAEISIQFIIR